MEFRSLAEATYHGLPAAGVASSTERSAIRVIGDPLALHDPVRADREPALAGQRSRGR
jgi:hypothetical protein